MFCIATTLVLPWGRHGTCSCRIHTSWNSGLEDLELGALARNRLKQYLHVNQEGDNKAFEDQLLVSLQHNSKMNTIFKKIKISCSGIGWGHYLH